MSRHLRYVLILTLVAFGTCLAAFGGWRYARVSAPVNGPIVLISVDSLRADRLPAYGNSAGKTPAIDALAAEGLVFDRAYSHVPQTLPAHASMLSGRLPFETGVRDGADRVIDDSERLLPEMLRDRGYATGGVVSSALLTRTSGIDQGFEFFDDALPAGAGGAPVVTRDGAEAAAIAERWLDGVGTPRAFLFLHLDDVRRLPSPVAEAGAAAAPPPYDEQVTEIDGIVGGLIERLKERGIYDQSTVILVADHGEGLGDHGEQSHGLFVYNDTVRVPLIIKPPAGSFTARRVAALVQHADLVPTVLDLAKAPVPGGLRGRSLTPLFDRDGTINQTIVYSESLFGERHFGWAALSTVTDGKYRYVSAPREELFDLETDPLAQRNIAEDDPATTGRLRELLRGLLTAAKGDPERRSEPAALTASERDLLESLGYVGVREPEPRPAPAPLDPKERWSLVERYREAAAFVAARDWAGATERFSALAHDYPASSDLWLRLARVATRAGRSAIALEAYRSAADIAPGNPVPRLGIAYTLLALRRFDDARAQAERLIGEEPADARVRGGAHEVLARVAIGRRDAETARAQAALAEAADPARPVRAYIDGRLAAELKHHAEAITALAPALAAVEQTPDLAVADTRLLAAESLLAEQRFSEAEYLFLAELKETPENPRARRGLGAVYTATGRTDEARALAQ